MRAVGIGDRGGRDNREGEGAGERGVGNRAYHGGSPDKGRQAYSQTEIDPVRSSTSVIDLWIARIVEHARKKGGRSRPFLDPEIPYAQASSVFS
jgi:hypothetical protein